MDNLRSVYVDELINLSKKNQDIVVLDSDAKEPLLLSKYEKLFPNRCFGFGISEQDMVSAAGGMTTFGLIPFVNSYGMFIAMRALDQVRNAVAYPNLNVKFVISHHGLDAGADGITHQLTEDISIFRTIPNLKILQPADSIEMKQMIKYSVDTHGPFIIKAGKSKVPVVHNKNYTWEYGLPSLIKDGKKIVVVTGGVMVQEAIEAAKILKQSEDINLKIINLSTLTNIMIPQFLKLFDNVEFVITLEDHSIYGGLGSIVAEILSEHSPKKIIRLGMKDSFAQCGSPKKLFSHYKMDSEALVQAARSIISI